MVVPDIFPWIFNRRETGLVVEQLDVGDQGVGDEHSVERRRVWMVRNWPSTTLISASGSMIFWIRLVTSLATSAFGPARRWSRRPVGSQARGVAGKLDEPGLRRRWLRPGRPRPRIDRDHPGDLPEGDRRGQRRVRNSRWREGSRRGRRSGGLSDRHRRGRKDRTRVQAFESRCRDRIRIRPGQWYLGQEAGLQGLRNDQAREHRAQSTPVPAASGPGPDILVPASTFHGQPSWIDS